MFLGEVTFIDGGNESLGPAAHTTGIYIETIQACMHVIKLIVTFSVE